jgi:hypothetical protein
MIGSGESPHREAVGKLWKRTPRAEAGADTIPPHAALTITKDEIDEGLSISRRFSSAINTFL